MIIVEHNLQNNISIRRSSYEGSWNYPLGTMEGYGTYTYPDGSEYKGYFKDNLFEGHGTLKFLYPQKFIIKGFFERGRCKRINELFFDDGLKFKGKINDDGTLNADDWKYCIEPDRRFHDETYSFEPYDTYSNSTCQRIMPNVPKGTYDTRDGFYQPQTGFLTLTEKTGEMMSTCFVGCSKQHEWIIKNCRLVENVNTQKNKIPKKELSPEIARKAIDTNFLALCKRDEYSHCICKTLTDCERHFGNLCLMHSSDVPNDTRFGSNQIVLTRSSSSIQSFSCDTPCPRRWTANNDHMNERNIRLSPIGHSSK